MKGIGVPWVNQPAPTLSIMKNFGHYIINCNLSESWLIDLTTIYHLPLAPLILVLLKSPSCRFSWIHNEHKKASVNAFHPVNPRQSLRSRVEGILFALPFETNEVIWRFGSPYALAWGNLCVRSHSGRVRNYIPSVNCPQFRHQRNSLSDDSVEPTFFFVFFFGQVGSGCPYLVGSTQ
jgi:hypothetical protein